MSEIDWQKKNELQQFVYNNREHLKKMLIEYGMIETIKFIRAHVPNTGLAEGKDIVDNYLLTLAEKMEYYKQRQNAILREG